MRHVIPGATVGAGIAGRGNVSFTEGGHVAITDRYEFDSLVNDAERMVLQELESQLATAIDVCTCQDCVLDMAAFSLNNVKPAYRVSLMGSVYAGTAGNAQHAQSITRAVREAIAKVKANPSHD
jgi:competence protein ComFB